MTRQTRIPVDDVGPYERWEMPDLTGVRRSISRRLEELEAQREAEALAEQAEQAENLPLVEMPSDEEIEALKAQAYQEGHQEGVAAGHAEGYEQGRAEGYAAGEREGGEAGFQSGYEKGLEQARNEIDQLSARFQSQLDQLLHPLAHVDDDAEQALLELAELIATGVLRRELTIDRSSLAHIVQEALKALPDTSRRLRIHVHPDDKVLVEVACEGRFDDYRIVDDPEVTPGGVHIETQYSLIDCTVERRYRALVEKLMGEQYPNHPPSAGPLPRRAESDSPLGPGHFSAEAALAELESLREELAAVLGDAVPAQSDSASKAESSDLAVAQESTAEQDSRESEQAAAPVGQPSLETHHQVVEDAQAFESDTAPTDDMPLDVSSVADAPADASDVPIEQTESVSEPAPVQPVRVSLSSASDQLSREKSTPSIDSEDHPPSVDQPGEERLASDAEAEAYAAGDLDAQRYGDRLETSPADLVTQAAASVQQSVDAPLEEEDWSESSLADAASIYGDRYAFDNHDAVSESEGHGHDVNELSHHETSASDASGHTEGELGKAKPAGPRHEMKPSDDEMKPSDE